MFSKLRQLLGQTTGPRDKFQSLILSLYPPRTLAHTRKQLVYTLPAISDTTCRAHDAFTFRDSIQRLRDLEERERERDILDYQVNSHAVVYTEGINMTMPRMCFLQILHCNKTLCSRCLDLAQVFRDL